jgi:hypothetical protein
MVSPDIDNKKIIILGTGKSSLLLFSILLQNDVYVTAFLNVGSDDINDLKIMNKPIVSEDYLTGNKEKIVIVAAGQDMLSYAEKLESTGFEVYYDFNFTSYEGDSVILQGYAQ